MTRKLVSLVGLALLVACSTGDEQAQAEPTSEDASVSADMSSGSSPAEETNQQYLTCAENIQSNPQFQGMPAASRETMVQANCAGFLEEAATVEPVAGNDRYNQCAANIVNTPQFQGMPNSSREVMVQANCSGFLGR